MLFSKEKAELTQRVADLEAQLATVTTERDAAQTNLAQAQAQIAEANTAHAAAITTLNEQHAAAMEAQRTTHEANLQAAITDALATAGVPEADLPGRAKQGGSTTYAEAVEHYKTLTDPVAAANYYAATIAPLIGRN